MGSYAGPANAWSNFTDQNRIDASTKVVVQVLKPSQGTHHKTQRPAIILL